MKKVFGLEWFGEKPPRGIRRSVYVFIGIWFSLVWGSRSPGRALLPAIMVVVVRTPKHAATPWLDKFDIIARSARPTAKAPTAP